MAKVTVIGLGPMGSALARALVDSGHDVTVWNRSPEKLQPLVEIGASPADSIADAVGANPFIVVCIDNYDSTRRLLGADDLAPLVHGRTIVQLSTGTPAEAQ